jgi:hypothetical protein
MVEMTKEEKPHLSRNGISYGYYVEARMTNGNPKLFGDQIFDGEWRRVHFSYDPAGVPPRDKYDYELAAHSLLSYEGAQALRWWLLAEAEYASISTRLRRYEVRYTSNIYEKETVDEQGGRFERAISKV